MHLDDIRVPALRSSCSGVATPEKNREEDHEEGVGSQISSRGEIRVAGGCSDVLLELGEKGCLPPYEW